MDTTPCWQAMRISHLDMMLAWDVCSVASRESGAITKVALDYNLSVSIVQKAVDRVEIAMGGHPFFVMGKKRTSKLSADGARFLQRIDALMSAWRATLSPEILE